MKTEVKKTKRFWHRGNVLDIAILLIVIASIVSIGYRYYQTREGVSDEQLRTAELTLTAQAVEPGVINALTQGNVVYLKNTGEVLGTLEKHPQATGSCPVEFHAASVIMTDEHGNYVQASMPDGTLLDLTAVIKSRGTVDEEGVFLLDGRYAVVPGQRISVYTERVSMVLTVTQVRTAY